MNSIIASIFGLIFGASVPLLQLEPASNGITPVVDPGFAESDGIIIGNGRELNGIIIMNGDALHGEARTTTGISLTGVSAAHGRLVY